MSPERRAFVIMTAIPPTRGHLALIKYASLVAPLVEVHLNTQPGEPFVHERYNALVRSVQGMPGVSVHVMHKTLPQEPTPEVEAQFWDMWAGFLTEWGITSDDFIVASEGYGAKLAEITGATFIPYDIARGISRTKGTWIRDDPLGMFKDIAPEFQKVLRKRVTIFGAESNGKTTLSNTLAHWWRAPWYPEWARPYLEAVGAEISAEKMHNIVRGQNALQGLAESTAEDHPFIIQDTDLYSTLGYWEANTWLLEESAPDALRELAMRGKSDLYVIPRSNIPFEPDQLRYGGDDRELSDEWWIDFAERNMLNYVVLEESDSVMRTFEAIGHMTALFNTTANQLNYTREGAEYRKETT